MSALSETRWASSGWARALILGLSLLLVAVPAGASEPVRFEYDAPAECPNEAAFVERVRERSLHGRFAAEGELARTFVVTLALDESGATARVDFVDADGSQVFRRVRGNSCEEAVSGIALVTALAIDGRATPEGPNAPEEAVPVATPPPVTAPAAPAAPASQPIAPPPSETRAAPARERPRDSTLSFSAGIGAGYASHKGPSGAPTFDVFAGVRRSDYGPAARASAWHFQSEATSGVRQARFRGYGLRLEACPLALGSAPWFVEPCLATDGGVVAASAVPNATLVNPRDVTKVWWDVLGLVRAGTLISDSFLVEAQGELAVPLVAYRFGFGDPPVDPDVFAVPPVGVSARAGIGFRFP